MERQMSEILDRPTLTDGQIYRWRWADEKRDADCAPYRSYHCKSQIAVVKNGRLVDTFWFGGGDNSTLNPFEVVLTPFADEAWPKISEYQVRYYGREDVADTRHSNNSHAPIYLRPGAVRSADRIAEEIEWLERTALQEIRSAENSLEWIRGEKAKLESGDLEGVSLPVLR
jgi:hypothetical protein